MNEPIQQPQPRVAGNYWTKLHGVSFVSVWNGETWRIPGQYGEMRDEEFDKIGTKPLVPEEEGFDNHGS